LRLPICKGFERAANARHVGTRKLPIIGINLGKNKDTPLEEAADDYVSLMRSFAPLADYLAINISSPNTAGLRRLQGRDMLENLLSAIGQERRANALPNGRRIPILVKLAPDLTDDELEDALDVILSNGMDGVYCTNTTLGRAGLRSRRQMKLVAKRQPIAAAERNGAGAGAEKVGWPHSSCQRGGIMCPEDAKRRLDMGAALVQVFTGLVYAGPGLVQKIIRAV